MYKSARSLGFTLVELLVVITIIIIVTVAAIPSFTGYIKNQTVVQAQEQLKSDMRNIQNKALTGALADQTVGASLAQYWGIKFSTGAGGGQSRYEYFISATNNTCPAAFLVGQRQGYSDLNPAILVRVAANSCVYFSMANGAINTVPNFTQLIVGPSGAPAAGECRRVIFTTNGLIYNSKSTLCI